MTRRRLVAGSVALALLLVVGGIASRSLTGNAPIIRVVPLGPGTHPGDMVIDSVTHRAFLALYRDNGPPTNVLMLDTRSGKSLRTIPLPNQASVLAVDSRRGRLFVAGGIGASWYLSLVDTHSGKRLRTIPLSVNFGWMAVDEAHGRVFITTDDPSGANTVWVLDSVSGRRLQTLTAAGQSNGTYSVAVGGQPSRVTVTGDHSTGGPTGWVSTAYLTTFDAATGRRLHTISVTSASLMNPYVDTPAGRAYFQFAPPAFQPLFPLGRRQRAVNVNGGSIRIVDLRRNTTLRTIHLSDRPSGVIADAPLGHTFVTTSGPVRLVSTIQRNVSGAISGASQWLMPLKSYQGGIYMPSRADPVGFTLASL